MENEIAEAASSIERHGYCVASWQPQVVALATPLLSARHPIHVLNVSLTTEGPETSVVRALEQPLLALATDLRQAINAIEA